MSFILVSKVPSFMSFQTSGPTKAPSFSFACDSRANFLASITISPQNLYKLLYDAKFDVKRRQEYFPWVHKSLEVHLFSYF